MRPHPGSQSLLIVASAGTVLLHLLAAALGHRGAASESKPIAAVYIPVPSPFKELETFIEHCAKQYNLDLFHCPPEADSDDQLPVETVTTPMTPSTSTINGTGYISEGRLVKAKGGDGMKRALELYKASFPHIDAIMIGTRRGDPHGGECCAPLTPLSTLNVCDSEPGSSESDRPGLAAFRADKSHHQLVVYRGMAVPAKSQGFLLPTVR